MYSWRMSGISYRNKNGGNNWKGVICMVFWGWLLGVSWGWESNPNCEAGMDGPDCSIPYEKCADNGDRKCYNGSKCVRNNKKDSKTGDYNFHCDCSVAYGVSAFAGRECEHAATQVCEYSSSSLKKVSFCTNGGQCLEFVLQGEAHAGCDCPVEFVGSHCQYLKGTEGGDVQDTIPMNLDDANVYGTTKSTSSKGNTAVLVTTIIGIIFVTSLFTIFGVFMYRKHKYQRYAQTTDFSPSSLTSSPPHYEGEEFQIDDRNEML